MTKKEVLALIDTVSGESQSGLKHKEWSKVDVLLEEAKKVIEDSWGVEG